MLATAPVFTRTFAAFMFYFLIAITFTVMKVTDMTGDEDKDGSHRSGGNADDIEIPNKCNYATTGEWCELQSAMAAGFGRNMRPNFSKKFFISF